MQNIPDIIWANDLYRKLLLTTLILMGQAVLRRLIAWVMRRHLPSDSRYIYLLRKSAGYLITLLAVLMMLGVWVERLGDMSVVLGVMAAGLAFALQEVIGSFAGWLTIVVGKPFEVGDRVETGGIRGDVIDVTILRTTLMEVGNWLRGDHNTGRIVTVSNAFIFKEPLFNYSAHLHFIWDELTVPVRYGSDWQRAITIMIEAVKQNTGYQELLPQAAAQRREARRKFVIKITSLEPRVFVKMTDNWIELGMVYPVDTDSRRKFRSDISRQILAEFESAGIIIASQTVAIVEFPETGFRMDK